MKFCYRLSYFLSATNTVEVTILKPGAVGYFFVYEIGQKLRFASLTDDAITAETINYNSTWS